MQYKNMLVGFAIFCSLGIAFGVWYHGSVLVLWQGSYAPHKAVEQLRHACKQAQKKISIWVPAEREPYTLNAHEMLIPWFEDRLEANVRHLVKHWLTFLYDEGHGSKDLATNFVGYNAETLTLYVSFSGEIVGRNWSCDRVMAVAESLLKTIALYAQEIQYVQLLVNHAPLAHPIVDFSYPWPRAGFLSTESL